MGSYSTLRIGSRQLFAAKNGIDPLLMSLFRPSDKRIRKAPATEAVADPYDRAAELEDVDAVTIVEYRSTVAHLRDRLDLMGFTSQRARRSFERGIVRVREEAQDDLSDASPDVLQEHYRQKADVVARLSFEDWLAGFARIFRIGLAATPRGYGQSSLSDDYPVSYMLNEHSLGEGSHFGFPSYHSRAVLRAMCEAIPGDADVVMDLTDLVLGGWYDTDDDLVEEADYLVSADYQTTQRIIALTEGGSDKRVLEAAFELLYPQLREYFAFMDFDELNVPGGAPSLVTFVKAFAAAGVINRVVAIFDNDTAAAGALRSLNDLKLPANVAITQLPVLDELKNYPTLGPTGTALTDINGLAASIELYFGRDVLMRADGSLTPVQWKGFDKALGRYQGEITDKPILQERFAAKVHNAKVRPEAIASADWVPMKRASMQFEKRFLPCALWKMYWVMTTPHGLGEERTVVPMAVPTDAFLASVGRRSLRLTH